MGKVVSQSEAAALFGISVPTFKKTIEPHLPVLDVIKTGGGHMRFQVEQLIKIFGAKLPEDGPDGGGDLDGAEPDGGGDLDGDGPDGGGDLDGNGPDGERHYNLPRPAGGNARGVEYVICNAVGKRLQTWGIEPSADDIQAALGGGLYRVLKVEKRTGAVIGVRKHEIKDDMNGGTAAGGMFSEAAAALMQLTELSNKLKGGSGGDLFMKMFEMERQQNQILMQMILKNTGGGGSALGGMKEFAETIRTARELGFINDDGGGDGDGDLTSMLVEKAPEVINAIVTALSGGGAPAAAPLRLEPVMPPVPAVTVPTRVAAAPVAIQGETAGKAIKPATIK